MKALIKVDDILKSYGMDRDVLIKKNPSYEEIFLKLDKYYQKYESNPTDSLLNTTNNVSMMFIDKIKKENQEMFEVEEMNPDETKKEVEDKFAKYKEEAEFYIDEGDKTSLDDLFNHVGEKNTKYLLMYEDFKLFYLAVKSKDILIISLFKEIGEKYKMFQDMLLARNGKVLNLIIGLKKPELIKESINAIKDREDVKEIFEKNRIEEQIIELGNDELVDLVDDILEKESGEATQQDGETQVEEKEKKTRKYAKALKEQTPLKEIMDMLNSGKIKLDTPLVVKLEEKFSIKVLDTSEDMAIGKNDTYKFVVPTPVANYFDSKILLQDNNFTLYEATKTVFEKQFGLSVYELGICWFNLINLVSIEDLLALFYIGNISTVLMVDRNNQQLRNDYLNNLAYLIKNPEANKIMGRYFQIKEANLKILQKYGFLDENLCPTKLLYAAMVLHSFPFPAFTHPFEFVNIDILSSMFQFQKVRGDFGNETFYTDGDLLYLNYPSNPNESNNYAQSLSDTARTVILNIKSNGRSDIKKENTIINHFIPCIYTVPKSGVSIPTFSIRILDMEKRKINWGVYELSNNGNKVYINSYALSNDLLGQKEKDYTLMQYEGILSDTMFANPTNGVVIKNDNSYLVIRGLVGEDFLSENFGKNWKNYYDQMYGKNHLVDEVLDKLDPDMVKAIYTSSNDLVTSTETGLQYKVQKTYETTYQKEVIKPTPQIKKVVVPVAKKDDRVYISKAFSREKLDRGLWDIFDAVQNLVGEQRDEAILDEMYNRKIDRVFPNQLVYLGFGLKEYVVDKPEKIRFKNKYKLTIPILLSYQPTYYLEKI